MPQLQVQQVSYAPNLFRTIKPHKQAAVETGANLLHDISFEVFAGDRIAIVGASGAGKTTLLRLLNRLSEPTKGRLLLDGQPYSSIPTVQLRQQVVLVLQESKLLGMTVQEAIAYPLKLRGWGQKEITQRVSEWLERLHIPPEWRDRTEQQLSVGQRQLVAIARALAIAPPLLLCDEPTAALDIGRTQQVLRVFTELSETRQMTILMVNHQLDLAKQLATRVLHLQNGTLMADQAAASIDWIGLEHHLNQVEQIQAAEWDL
jgi:D-methionine transport system ATP-binding protein